MLKKEIKNFEKFVEIGLIALTIISLMINALEFTNIIYNWSYDTAGLNSLLISKPFNILLWTDNILIYLFGLFYIICAFDSKKDRVLKIAFSIFAILTTIVVSTLIINGVASLFGIF